MPDAQKREDPLLARIVELRLAQAIGALPPPGQLTQDQLASALGISRRQLARDEQVALAKLLKAFTTSPELIPLISNIIKSK